MKLETKIKNQKQETNATAQKNKSVANIHQALTGRWHITDNGLPYLDESGSGQISERRAINSARACGYTHRVARSGKIVKL